MTEESQGTCSATEHYPDIFDAKAERIAGSPTPASSTNVYARPNIDRKRLYIAARYLLRKHFEFSIQALPAEPSDLVVGSLEDEVEARERLRLLAVYGQLLLKGYADPSLGRLDRGSAGPQDEEFVGMIPAAELNVGSDWQLGQAWIPASSGVGGGLEPLRVVIAKAFKREFADVVENYVTNKGLYEQAFLGLKKHGRGRLANGDFASEDTTLAAKQLAAVVERLIVDQVSASDPYISVRVDNAISSTLGEGGGGGGGGGGGVRPSARDIRIPDLDAGTAVEILPENLHAVRFIYFSAQMEEMKLHAVLDKIVEHFQIGMLPVARGRAADKIHHWIKTASERITEIERRSLYGRVLGFAQGGTEILPNREFSDLWLRFLSTVSQKYREIASLERDLVSVEQVHKSARDLAVNCSLHGFGWASPAAVEMIDIVNETFSILDEQEVLMAYGVRDRWQLVDRVSALYLGGNSNGVKHRALAETGQQILKWMAESAPVLASGSASGLNVIDYAGGARIPTAEFRRLSEWCERWLAATGTPDATAARNTDPVDLPSQSTVPMLGQHLAGMPQSVQDALRQVGGNVPNLPEIPQA